MLYELNIEFNYQIRYTQIDDDSLEIDLIVSPDLKCYDKERDECSVFDFFALYEEMDRDSSYYPITCECGCPDDTAIYAPINQKVTDSEIYWDIPIIHYPSVFNIESQHLEDGTLRLIFNKQQYQHTILQMISQIKLFITNGIKISTIKETDFINLYGSAYFFQRLLSKKCLNILN